MVLRCVLLVVAILALSAASFAGPQFWNLGAGTTTGITNDGSAVAFHTSTNAYIWSKTYGAVDLGAGSTAGIAYTTYNAPSGKYVIGGNRTTGASRWDGNLAGTGSWATLPLVGGTASWQVRCTGAGSADVFFGGMSGAGTSVDPYKACRYKESSNSSTNLSLPGGGCTHNSYVNGISGAGVYAGQCQFGGSPPTGGSRQSIGGNPLVLFNNLQGAPSTSNSASGSAISDNGSRIVGWSSTGVSGQQQACYWTAPFATGLAPTAIPFLPGHDYSRASAINASGSIIGGYSQSLAGGSGTRNCWIWDSVNGTRDLRQLMIDAGLDLTGWQLTDVKGISADGKWITGVGTYNAVSSGWVAFIPEPSSLSVLALGLLGLLKLRRRT